MSPTEPLVKKYPLKKRKILKKVLESAHWASVAFAVFSLAAGLLLPFGVVLFAIPAIFAIVASGVIVYYLLFLHYYWYDLTSDGLAIRKGVFARWRITVPANKVQDVYLDQDVLDRLLGLYDLHLASATEASEHEAHIDGLGAADAEELRAVLLTWLSGRKAGNAADALPSVGAVVRVIPVSLIRLIETVAPGFVIGLGLTLLFPPFILVTAILIAIPFLAFIGRRYELRKDGVFVRTGFFIPKESIFLYRSIQDVEDNQSFLDRILDMHTLLVKTMTEKSAILARLPYVGGRDAAWARAYIQERSRRAAAEQLTPKETAECKLFEGKPGALPVAMPFPPHFYRIAAFDAGVYVAGAIIAGVVLVGAALFASSLGAAGMLDFIVAVPFLLGGAVALAAFMRFALAFVKAISYSYSVGPDAMTITIRLFSSVIRRIPFSKVQDIEKRVSFANSIAGLANIALESGAKEEVSVEEATKLPEKEGWEGVKGRGGVVSKTVANERIPALSDADAEKLKAMFASRMCISLDGIGVNPLSRRLPLSARKPLKKTALWAIVIIPAVAALGVAGGLAGSALVSGAFLASFIAGALALAAKYGYESEYAAAYFFDSNREVAVIRKGLFGSRELTIPFDKIQQVFVDRDVLDAVFGLYDVFVSTATERSILNAHIDGLDRANAETVATLIIDSIAAKR